MNTSGDRGVSAGGNITGSIIQTGDHNVATLTVTQLPPSDSVDIAATLAELRTVLTARGGGDAHKINNALDEADEEAARPAPDKAEVAGILSRALGYAKKAGDFSDTVEKLTPLVTKIAGWIGSAAAYAPLLAHVGLVAG